MASPHWLQSFAHSLRLISRKQPRARRHLSPLARWLKLEDRVAPSTSIPLSSSSWTLMGPAPIINGAIFDNNNFPVSGRVTAVAADPVNSAIIYIATAGGGVWKTTNANAAVPTWAPLTDSQATLACGAIAIAKSSPNTVYVGTGESNFSRDSNHAALSAKIDEPVLRSR
jgi:hypothetical protein